MIKSSSKEPINVPVKEIIEKTDAYERCRNLITSFIDEAGEILEEFDDSEAKESLSILLRDLRD